MSISVRTFFTDLLMCFYTGNNLAFILAQLAYSTSQIAYGASRCTCPNRQWRLDGASQTITALRHSRT